MIEVCPGCKASLEAVDGPTHRYIGASPACWQIYSMLGAGGYAIAGSGRYGDLLVDAYAAQHPGHDSPQARQSVAVHLVTLWAVLRAGAEIDKAIDIRVRVVSVGKRTGGFEWLEPAPESYPLTVGGFDRSRTDRRRLNRSARGRSPGSMVGEPRDRHQGLVRPLPTGIQGLTWPHIGPQREVATVSAPVTSRGMRWVTLSA